MIREKAARFKMCKDMGVEDGFKDYGSGRCQSNRMVLRGVRTAPNFRDGMH